jgi:hypothetical protein
MVVLGMNQHTLPETGKGTRTGTLLQTRHRGATNHTPMHV